MTTKPKSEKAGHTPGTKWAKAKDGGDIVEIMSQAYMLWNTLAPIRAWHMPTRWHYPLFPNRRGADMKPPFISIVCPASQINGYDKNGNGVSEVAMNAAGERILEKAIETVAERDRLEDVNNALVEALRKALAHFTAGACCDDPSHDLPFAKELKAAISKAKEKSS